MSRPPIRWRSIRRASIPAVVKREKDVLADKFRQQGKPEAMIEKIVEFGLKTFYKEQTLLEQPFIFDDKKSVGQALKEAEGKVGAPVKVTGFVRYALSSSASARARTRRSSSPPRLVAVLKEREPEYSRRRRRELARRFRLGRRAAARRRGARRGSAERPT